MTRADIRDRILTGLNESTSSPVFWSTAQMNAVIEEGQEVLAEEAAAIKRTAITTLRPGALYYTTRGIASDMMAPYRIWLHATNRKLTAVHWSHLDRYHERWQEVTGLPQVWASMSWDFFALYPHPAEGGGVLRVDYLAWPRALSSDSDRPECLESEQDAMVLYGVYTGLLKRWDAAMAQAAFIAFLDRIGQGKSHSGERLLQSRAWQQARQPGTPFRSDVGSRWTS
jgi:hypothetical protein